MSLNVFWMLTMARGSAHKDLVWDFFLHCATPAMDKLTTMEGAIGVRRSTWADADVNRAVPYYHKLEDLHARARELPVHPRLSEIAHVIDAMMTEATTTERATADLLAEGAGTDRRHRRMSFDPAALPQSWPLPAAPRPIVILGAGGIVRDADMPAYRKAGFPVAGVFDIDPPTRERHRRALGHSGLPSRSPEATEQPDAIFDLATPPGSASLFAAHAAGRRRRADPEADGPHARRGHRHSSPLPAETSGRRGQFPASLRPDGASATLAIDGGMLGRIIDVEVHLNLLTPWHLFPFVKGLERVEIAVHSIHYFDLIRAVLGNPASVHARTLGHPNSDIAQTRTAAIFLDFSSDQRCVLSINHDHGFGRRFQQANIRVEGEKGAAVIKTRPAARLSARRAGRIVDQRRGRVGAGALCRKLVPGCLRRAHVEFSTLCRGRRRWT